jgi:hypothetical protein
MGLPLAQMLEAPAFVLPQRMVGGGSVLQAPHVQEVPFQIDLFPPEVDQFRYAQPVPVSELYQQ